MSNEYSPADVVTNYLIAENIGTPAKDNLNWLCRANFQTDEPDNTITIYDTITDIDGRLQATGEVIEHPAIQIRVRAKDQPTGYSKATEIKNALDAVKRTEVDMGDRKFVIAGIHRLSGVVTLGTDEDKKRHLFTINALLTLKEI